MFALCKLLDFGEVDITRQCHGHVLLRLFSKTLLQLRMPSKFEIKYNLQQQPL